MGIISMDTAAGIITVIIVVVQVPVPEWHYIGECDSGHNPRNVIGTSFMGLKDIVVVLLADSDEGAYGKFCMGG
jgi:hypothetical protein